MNFAKPGVLFSKGLDAGSSHVISNVLEVWSKLDTERYLGVSTLVRRNRNRAFKTIQGKVWKRLQYWQGRKLSKSAKEVLINTVVQALPTSNMKVLLLSDTLIEELERMMCSFWWRSKWYSERGISRMKCCCSRITEAAPAASLVTHLPGFTGTFPSQHYSGYVRLENEKNMFYYFIESERNSKADPVVLWLNGGPGCSSFDGFVYEHGPFSFEKGKSRASLPRLHLNPFSWSKVSNIIYLDSPCGVGLSYSPNASNYQTDDRQTAFDSHHFLLKWFELYPEFQQNPFYISGESYAGIYVPTLSAQVVQGIKAGEKPTINFKGYLVGNGVANDEKTGGLGAFVHFVHGMALISDKMFQQAAGACKPDFSGQSQKCADSIRKIDRAVDLLNIYDVLEPCYHDPEGQRQKQPKLPTSFQELGKTDRPLQVRKRMFGRAWPLWADHFQNFRQNSSSAVSDYSMPLWPQLAQKAGGVMCVNDEVATAWLNDETVRKALHAQPVAIAGAWELCSDRISYGFGAGDMVPIHRNLTMQGYRALIYSGDHDMCVPYTGTEAWTSSLGYSVIDEWRPWISGDDNQVAGYLEGYEHNLTFLTIKGAGHTVPEYKPRESLDFFTRFLDAKPI